MPNLARILLNRARSQPEAPAITGEGATMSFGELADRVLRLAGALRGPLGLNTDDRVVLSMENTPAFYELLFACWAGGLAAVPVNAKLHPREVSHIVSDSAARAVFTSERLVGELEPVLRDQPRPPKLNVVGSASYESLASGPRSDCAERSPADLAWLFYTSGTTGKPKGAMLTHRNLLAMSWVYFADVEFVAPGDVKLHAAPLSHASGLYGLPHLFAGGHQLILSSFEPEQIFEAFATHRRVTLFAAPTMVIRMLQSPGVRAAHAGLRTLYYGGAPMYVSDLQRALDVFGPRLWQLYGQGESPMTLTGLSKAGHLGDGGPEHLSRLGSVGVARTGVEVRVVGENGEELAPGQVGEVVSRSDCVMAGYWNNPSASANALRNGWLWTGDVGSLDERGYLTLRDRSKDLIISGGSNIYPREIEEILLRHPAVLECSVVGTPDAEWGESVVAFVVARPGATVSPSELDALCLEHIARFKRPKRYHTIDTLPKNNYGKVLKTALRDILKQPG
jgi:acyl-CoA synthetase (AMP-forming)/AMP-acid ligase II